MPAEARPKWVHLGLGAFFRAFGLPWIEESGGWEVLGVSLRSPTTRDALRRQNWAYTAAELSPAGTKTRRIGVLSGMIVGPENPETVHAALCDPRTRIVSLTVTEKGYCHDPATGQLNFDHPDIQHDLQNELPRSAPGYLVRALAARRAMGLPPFTVLSCDNLPDNGLVARAVVTGLAARIDTKLAKWIDMDVAFPCAMVDRIVPATTPQDIEAVSALIGQPDAGPVMHEPFRQWVIQDDFPNGRPLLEAVGVQMVQDVASFEAMKLRMLNGTHSALAYIGYLSGHETVAKAIADPVLSAYIRHLWQAEIIPTLTPPEDTDLSVYAHKLLSRYQNPAIAHSTWQIAMDGSQKLPQRLLGTIRDRLDAGQSATGLLTAVAAWMRYTSGTDEQGKDIDVRDPMADRLRAAHSDDPAQTVQKILRFTDIFDPALVPRVEPLLIPLYMDLLSKGARTMAEEATS